MPALPNPFGTRITGAPTTVIRLNGLGIAVRSQLPARQARLKATPMGTTRKPVHEAR